MDPLVEDDAAYPEGNPAPGVGLGDLTGRQIGRYLIGQRIGSGGVATVYRAFDQVQGITVALKVLQPSADIHTYDRFKREALTAGALRHPNIVRILQVGAAPQGEVAYIAMELVEGESLADLLGARSSLHWDESCALLAPIADALDVAHRAGIVHRDVKPSNILLRPAQRGAPNSVALSSLDYPVTPLLSDFGIARTMDAPELTSAGRTVGTPAYMAPEQASASRTVDGRADIYALGTVLYRCVAGRLPYSGSATQILHAHVYEPLLIDSGLLNQLPPELVQVLRRTLAKNPAERYATAAQLAAALAQLGKPTQMARPAHDPHATATLSTAAAGTQPYRREPTSTSVLIPGVATTIGTAVEAPIATAGKAPTPPRKPNRRLFVWFASVAVLFVALGFLAGFVTFLSRLRTDQAAATPVAAGQAGLATSTFTPTASPTPTRILATDTPRAAPTDAPPPAASTPLPTFALIVEPEPATPTPVADTPEPTAQVSDTPSPTPFFTPTWTPVATPTPLDGSLITAVPTDQTVVPVDTETPASTPEPSATPTPEALPTRDDLPQPTPSVDASMTPGPVACAVAIHPRLADYLAASTEGASEAFRCPLGEATLATAELQPFQSGFMLRIGERPELLVTSLDGQWQSAGSSWQPGDPEPKPDVKVPDGLYVPSGAFLDVWMRPQINEGLGFALAPGPDRFQAVEQRFPGGLLVANLETGAVYPFASK